MRVLLICLLLAACATPQRAMPAGPGAHLAPGVAMSAPAGALAYCRMRPAECGGGVQPADGLRGSFAPVGAARSQPVRAGGADTSVFAALMAARVSHHGAQIIAPRHEMILTEARWAELRRVDRDINHAIAPVTDQAGFGVSELWRRPLMASGPARGDCEDYALEKRARLIALGWPQDALAMAIAMAPGVGLHAVLIAQTDRGDFVLDNFGNEPTLVDSVDYVWLSRQVGAQLTTWASARVAAPAMMLAASARAPSPEALFQRLMAERADALTASRETAIAAPLTPVEISVAPQLSLLPTPSKRREPKETLPADLLPLQRIKGASLLSFGPAGESAEGEGV